VCGRRAFFISTRGCLIIRPPFVCELCHAYDPVSKSWTAGVAVKLISGGCNAFLREIPDKTWRTLCFVMLRMESDGRRVVTEEELARDRRSLRMFDLMPPDEDACRG
jgi:hypothetical protein